MASLDEYLQLLVIYIETKNTEMLSSIQSIIYSISNKVSSPILKSHFALLASHITNDPNKAIQFIKAYPRNVSITQTTQEPVTILIRPIIEISLLNTIDNSSSTKISYYSKEDEISIGSTKLKFCCELKKKTSEGETSKNQDPFMCIKVKDDQRYPSNICINNSGELLKSGQFFLVDQQEIIVIKNLNNQSVLLAIFINEQECEFEAKGRANYLVVKNQEILKTNSCFRGGFRIVKTDEGWTMWSNDNYCLMFLGNPFKAKPGLDLDWIDLPKGVLEIWINRVKYIISIKEC